MKIIKTWILLEIMGVILLYICGKVKTVAAHCDLLAEKSLFLHSICAFMICYNVSWRTLLGRKTKKNIMSEVDWFQVPSKFYQNKCHAHVNRNKYNLKLHLWSYNINTRDWHLLTSTNKQIVYQLHFWQVTVRNKHLISLTIICLRLRQKIKLSRLPHPC